MRYGRTNRIRRTCARGECGHRHKGASRTTSVSVYPARVTSESSAGRYAIARTTIPCRPGASESTTYSPGFSSGAARRRASMRTRAPMIACPESARLTRTTSPVESRVPSFGLVAGIISTRERDGFGPHEGRTISLVTTGIEPVLTYTTSGARWQPVRSATKAMATRSCESAQPRPLATVEAREHARNTVRQHAAHERCHSATRSRTELVGDRSAPEAASERYR